MGDNNDKTQADVDRVRALKKNILDLVEININSVVKLKKMIVRTDPSSEEDLQSLIPANIMLHMGIKESAKTIHHWILTLMEANEAEAKLKVVKAVTPPEDFNVTRN